MTVDHSCDGRAKRAAQAVYLTYAKGYTQDQIARELGVSQTSVSKYLNSEPHDKIKKRMQRQVIDVRMLTMFELERQYQAATEREETATQVTPDWDDEDDITFVTIRDGEGQIKDRFPLPDGFSAEVDHEAQADARKEIRDIIDAMQKVTGTPDTTIEVTSGDGVSETGGIGVSWFGDDEDDTEDENG